MIYLDEILNKKSNIESNIELLKYCRKLRNMNQRTLANKSGLYLGVIVKLELGKILFTLNTCERISKALNISPTVFYDDYLNFIINSQKNLKRIR